MIKSTLGFLASLVVVGVGAWAGCGGSDSDTSTVSSGNGGTTTASNGAGAQGGSSVTVGNGGQTSSTGMGNTTATTGPGMGGAGQGGAGQGGAGVGGGGFSCDPTGDPCQDCVGMNCCDETKACIADPECSVCLVCLNNGGGIGCFGSGDCSFGDPETSTFTNCAMQCQNLCQ